ncbi:polyhydroxyalkanoic acid system family protein [Novosphingobium sp.]|uniref:polyhydroxyalkanoic acid system family protein n=1 Tax=Novosphingobium sp. TaxID=1874826 RepID=UPI00286A223C|nr:polyhydroxyalkanoic acid system family protein [Novosphingobium sp.]
MRIPIPHSLGREEARRRLHDRSGEMAGLFPGGMAQVAIDWPSENRMAMAVTAMGKTVDGHVDVEDHAVVFEIQLPAALAFFEPMVRGAIEDKARKLLT